MYRGQACYGYALNCHLVYLAIPGTHPLYMKMQKFVCFDYMQTQKVKFKSVQSNMKQVSYNDVVGKYKRETYFVLRGS